MDAPHGATLHTSRVIGRHGDPRSGPTLVCLAGIHGNEPSGVIALRRLFDRLGAEPPRLRGSIIGLAGNLQALARGERFLGEDLNRMWVPARLDAPARGASPAAAAAPEEHEFVELREAIRAATAEAPGPVHFLDLHTTSSASVPFAVINDTLPNRAFARQFPVPVILGLEEHIVGTVADFTHRLGCITVGFEAGRHDDPRSVTFQEAALWVALGAIGAVDPAGALAPAVADARSTLAAAGRGQPRFLEITHRHPVTDHRVFRMRPGFENFHPIAAGTTLASDNGRELTTPRPARLFMPLYNNRGDDGYFLARPVRSVWLALSSLARSLGLGAVVHWLPGVRRHPTTENSVIVQPRIARWLVNEVLHLLGYRKRPAEGERLVYSRRLHDIWQRRRR